MDLHATVIRKFLGPAWAGWERSRYLAHLNRLEDTEYDSPPTIQARQFKAVRDILTHAYKTVPFYRNRWQGIGLHPDDINNFQDFQAVPILTKADIRAHGRDLLSYVYTPEKLIRKKTSGSTGVSLEIFLDEDSRQWKRACALRSDQWSGWRFGEPVARIWGN